MLPSEDYEDSKASWQHHPHSARLRNEMKNKRAHLLVSLYGACRKSHDPDVRAAIRALDDMEEMLGMFGGNQ